MLDLRGSVHIEGAGFILVLCGRKVMISDQDYHQKRTTRNTHNPRVFCYFVKCSEKYRDTIFYVATKQ